MTIRLRDSINQEPVSSVWEQPDFTTKICSKFPIGSKELQALLRVSKHLRKVVYDIYRINVENILKRYANYDTPLNRIISTQSKLPLISIKTISEIQQFIIQQVKTLGIPCPNKQLVLEDIPRLNQAIEDLNLQKIWGPISQALAVEEKPEKNASAQEIRLWMNENKNHLQNIVQLDLSEKALTTIPREITLLTGLQLLYLYNNQITVLTQGVFDGLNQLQWLYLYNNQITVLPQGIFAGLIQLRGLYLYNNQITVLTQGVFDGLNQLQQLHLNNNQITDLPQGVFDRLNQLQWLALYFNRITVLPQRIFDQLNQLQWLGLHYNQITVLPQRIFDQLNQLQTLGLDNNQITFLPQGIFDQLNQLQVLDLNNNQITILSQGIFDRLNQLRKLFLDNNQITVLPQGIFDQLNQLQELYLYSNRRLLFSYQPMQISVNNLKAFKEFNGYVCRSSFAQFYKSVAQGNSFDNMMRSFSHLSPYLQVVINAKVREEPDNSLSCEERFPIALKKAVQWIFEMSTDQLKYDIYTRVFQLAHDADFVKNPALPPEDFSNPNWGRDHARDNILRLIDAMSLSANGLLG